MLTSIVADEPSRSEGLPRHVQNQIGARLNELIPSADRVDADTRLGRVSYELGGRLLGAGEAGA